MSNNKSFRIYGKVTNTGGLPITEIGFVLVDAGNYPPDYNGLTPPNIKWQTPLSKLNSDGTFSDVITGLTSLTYYYVRSYAKNSLGVSQSSYTTAPFGDKTTGIQYLPTVTCYIMNNGVSQLIYEIGTSNSLTVSGETIQNDETIFINGELNQTSQPSVSNPIRTWTGYQSTYSTTTPTPLTVNFIPTKDNLDSQTMTQTVNYYCGSPVYLISATTTAYSYYPFLWVLKDSIKPSSYYNNFSFAYAKQYFYKEASSAPNLSAPTNGKLVESKGPKQFLMTPSNASTKYLLLGYPESYGSSWYSLDGVSWTATVASPVLSIANYNVDTGPDGNLFGIQNGWSVPYRILQYNFSSYSSVPIYFYLTFTSP